MKKLAVPEKRADQQFQKVGREKRVRATEGGMWREAVG